MIRRFLLVSAGGLTLALIVALGVTASSWTTATALTNCTTSTAALDGDETSVAIAINQQRANQGLAPLLISPALSRASAWKSADSSNTQGPPVFGHTDSLGRSSSIRAQQCDYPGQAGENIALGFSASTVVTAWMNSSGHRANILMQHYKVMGVGHTGNSWVMNFGTVVDAGAYAVGSPAPPPPPPPTSTPTPTSSGGSGNNPPVTQPPTNTPTTAAGSAGQGNIAPPAPYKTVLPGGDKPQHMLPTHIPYKRATILMIASE